MTKGDEQGGGRSNKESSASEDGAGMTGRQVRKVGSRDLLGNGEELLIEHNGAIYRLRATRQGKLILTK
jgi:hemin uptake protein HemP